jgi:TolB-like protein
MAPDPTRSWRSGSQTGQSLRVNQTGIDPMNLLAELKRRNVIRMAGLYLVVAWLIVQVASSIFPAFDLPSWALRAVIVLLVIGFIPALVVSWVFELTPAGLKRETEVVSTPTHADAGLGRRHSARGADDGVASAETLAGTGTLVMTRRGLLAATTVLLVAGIASFVGWRRGLFTGKVRASGNSVAVLPFQNLSGDSSQDYFSDGLSAEIRATLARNRLLLVVAETSSGKFRDRKDDAQTIAAKLGVAVLLDGSVRRAGAIIRVTAELIDGETGFSRWTRTFDRSMDDIFAVQSEIADAVASALVAEIATTANATTGDPQELAASGGTMNVIAYDAYLRGRAAYDLSSDEASERAALALFDLAIAADPNYAAAHAARSRSLTAIANQYGAIGQLRPLYDAAVVSAERAIRLAPKFADGYSTLGFVLFQGRLDARSAQQPFQHSRQLGAGDANVLARFALYSARIGRGNDARDAMARALVLDPLNPLIHRAAGMIEYAAGNYSGSIPLLREALAMNPKMSRANAAIGDALLMLGQIEEARAAYAAEPAADFRLTGTAIVEQKLGHVPVAQAAQAKLVADLGDRVLYQQAQILAQWGEPVAALGKLERARVVGDSGLIYARNDPLLAALRNEPQLARLLASIGFDAPTTNE